MCRELSMTRRFLQVFFILGCHDPVSLHVTIYYPPHFPRRYRNCAAAASNISTSTFGTITKTFPAGQILALKHTF